MRRMAVTLLATGFGLAACGSSSNVVNPDGGNGSGGGGAGGTTGAGGADAAPALEAFNGIYAIDDVTLNSSGCTAEGPSVKASETAQWFIAEAVSVGSGSPEALALDGCTGVPSCESIATMARSLSVSGSPWVYGVSGLGTSPGGNTVNTTVAVSGMCMGETVAHATLTGVAGGTLRIEVRITDVPTHPARNGTTCDPSDIITYATGQPCSQLKVITGTFQQAL